MVAILSYLCSLITSLQHIVQQLCPGAFRFVITGRFEALFRVLVAEER